MGKIEWLNDTFNFLKMGLIEREEAEDMPKFGKDNRVEYCSSPSGDKGR